MHGARRIAVAQGTINDNNNSVTVEIFLEGQNLMESGNYEIFHLCRMGKNCDCTKVYILHVSIQYGRLAIDYKKHQVNSRLISTWIIAKSVIPQ
jgi:hypothetical protein